MRQGGKEKGMKSSYGARLMRSTRTVALAAAMYRGSLVGHTSLRRLVTRGFLANHPLMHSAPQPNGPTATER